MDITNERTHRHDIWHRHEGCDWAAFDSLPPSIRARLHAHAYDAWAVNVALLWRHYKRSYGATARAERALIRYLDYCERLERENFAQHWQARFKTRLPHDAADVSILRA